MRAAVYHGQRDVRVENVEPRSVGPNDVAIEVAYCGICGSDVHEYAAGPIAIPDENTHSLTDETLPLTLGHEFSGTVSDAGEAVDDVTVGDRVTVNPAIWCGECRFCQEGNYHRCVSGGSIGLAGWGGGLAERAVVPASQVVPVPDDVGLDYATLTEPYAVALHAVRRSSLQSGDDCAVFGAGPIGLGIAQTSRLAGARRVYVSEPQDGRRAVADELGMRGIDPTDVDPVRWISSRTNGGTDVAYEAAGVEPALETAIRTTIRGGEVLLVSVFEDEATIQPNYLMMAERSIVGSIAYRTGPRAAEYEFAAVLEALSDDRLDPDPLVTKRIDLDDVVEDGFEALTEPGEQVKILVSP
ncbi:2,3-butanediol dehydrogenase [Natronomonas salsuginis]|jgi:(R,R)-butanediol dehydrogenase/meso-butanediol dehydrogenase/diacetyl reductase|uniref:2,3-butanediol dehydrogenase n=1 Tax=Natronomonas salsuginis TaxID=2217661 RepID=A0A4U5J7V9_9EURY|nr:2,3-butanediol dehydrogenase [Natronomonas salsuginis]TKR25142.1 2,3-butanediol dehydrogenase [Natronomonas salsuginis]